MALQATDLFIVQRGGVSYQMSANQIADFVGAVRDYTTATIATRDAGTLTPTGVLKIGDRVFVGDATADNTVTLGWAIYRVNSIGPIVFQKIQEQESMDMVISPGVTNLGYTAAPTNGTITNDNGDGVIIPLANATNAGLMPPAAFSAIHVAATAGLTPQTNPIVINGSQQVTFNITQLTALP